MDEPWKWQYPQNRKILKIVEPWKWKTLKIEKPWKWRYSENRRILNWRTLKIAEPWKLKNLENGGLMNISEAILLFPPKNSIFSNKKLIFLFLVEMLFLYHWILKKIFYKKNAVNVVLVVMCFLLKSSFSEVFCSFSHLCTM